jgi:hypothetical protein
LRLNCAETGRKRRKSYSFPDMIPILGHLPGKAGLALQPDFQEGREKLPKPRIAFQAFAISIEKRIW